MDVRGAILLIDGSGADLENIIDPLAEAGYVVEAVHTGREALNQASSRAFDLVLTDLILSDMSATELIGRISARWPGTITVALTEAADVPQAVEVMKAGADDCLIKPIQPEAVLDILALIAYNSNDIARLPGRDYLFGRFVGQSQGIEKVFQVIDKVADTDSTVLISGESGTGKELVARAIHVQSARRSKPLVPVNCGAIPEELLESELFGHEKGAFTNAIQTRLGRFELAEGGSVFLDEIGEMSPKLQVKLLRVLQDHQFERIGGTRTITADIRIIAATNQDLEQAVSQGRFREDLFYRLNVIPIHVPPLRERSTDISHLVEHFLNRFRLAKKIKVKAISDQAMAALQTYHWPGNIRELENLIERMVILSDGPEIRLADLPERFQEPRPHLEAGDQVLPEEGVDLKFYLTMVEENLIQQALARSGGKKAGAARLLRLNRTTLVEKMKKKGLL